MIHHLRGTSAALAENVLITGEKRHRNYGRGLGVSTLLTTESTSPSPHRQGRMAPEMLSRNYNASPPPFTHRLFALCPAFVCCDPSASAAIPDHVTAAVIIHEMNLARQNP